MLQTDIVTYRAAIAAKNIFNRGGDKRRPLIPNHKPKHFFEFGTSAIFWLSSLGVSGQILELWLIQKSLLRSTPFSFKTNGNRDDSSLSTYYFCQTLYFRFLLKAKMFPLSSILRITKN